MIDTKTLVDDTLLRELSVETRKIGSRVLVKRVNEHPGYIADILDIIILPYADFYRTKFMNFYRIYNYNAVKALKELNVHFPFIPDFELGIGYILNISSGDENSYLNTSIKIKTELQF